MKSGIELIAEERKRQIEKEGWTPEHDDAHGNGTLAIAASCYIDTAHLMADGETAENAKEFVLRSDWPTWPWANEWFKPKSPIQDLVRAGALIAAEIDRLQRKPK